MDDAVFDCGQSLVIRQRSVMEVRISIADMDFSISEVRVSMLKKQWPRIAKEKFDLELGCRTSKTGRCTSKRETSISIRQGC